jgi:KaiC/GvpD/RAD55 family RecA-like ATPase
LSSTERVPSGIPGLDEIMGGGFPKERVILIVGGPGTGKTILTAQFLVNGIKKYGENAVFVSMDENREHIAREMGQFKWDLEKLENEKKFAFVDASPIRHLPGEVKLGKLTVGKRDFSLISVVEGIRKAFESINAKRVVVDSLASLTFNYPDPIQRRTGILDLIEALSETKTTCLMTSELRSSGLERGVQLEEYLAHGVISLQTIQVGGKSFLRAIQVVKMRETPIDLQPRPYRITENGIEVYPNETIF